MLYGRHWHCPQVKLTWDEDDVHRKRVLGRRPAADELKDDDFKAR